MVMGKLGMLLAAGAGYVLGTRAGRERYEQLRYQAKRLWSDPHVQESKAKVQQVAQQKGSQAQGKIQGKIQDKLPDRFSTATSASDRPTSTSDLDSRDQSAAAGALHPTGADARHRDG